MIEIEYATPRHPQISALLGQSHALMNSLFPPEACFYLDIDALCEPHIHFFAARVDGAYLACGALAAKQDYAEVKSFFTTPSARGQGLGDLILSRIQQQAIELGIEWLKLETGVGLDAAHRLYHRAGFTNCGPFGEYELSPYSVYMQKQLR